MNCSLFEEMIQEKIDRPLSNSETALLETHLASCEACVNYQKGIVRVANELHRAGKAFETAIPVDLTDRLGLGKRRQNWLPWGAIAASVILAVSWGNQHFSPPSMEKNGIETSDVETLFVWLTDGEEMDSTLEL